jgi:lysozyme family protein
MPVTLTQSLRREYERLFRTCQPRPERAASVEKTIGRILDARARYESASAASGVPWFVIAVLHCMESSLRFDGHLHNGDPLTARTVQVPKGRPRDGAPPFSWEESAADALASHRLGRDTDWSLGSSLFQIERYNGFGYRLQHPEVLSPYLWSFSGHYTAGKFVADGRFSATAVSSQCGAAVLLRRMAEHGHVRFADDPAPAADNPLVVPFSRTKPADPALVRRAEDLQRFLNTFPGVFVKVDGIPGERTSAAFRRVTGTFLPGDPRETRG